MYSWEVEGGRIGRVIFVLVLICLKCLIFDFEGGFSFRILKCFISLEIFCVDL